MCAEKQLQVLREGEEPDSFWEFLGGKGTYTTELDEPTTPTQNRLFHCYMDSTDRIKIEEIPDFNQEVL